MRKKQKFNKKSEDVTKDGPPWTVVAHCSTYNEAVKKVEEQQEMGADYDYKIRRGERDFRVKKRLRLELMKQKTSKKKKR